MSIAQRRKRTEELRRMPLTAVLRAYGARRDREDKGKWHTSRGTLSVTGAKFINWHSGSGGGGAIDLVMHLEHSDFKQAWDWLDQHFSGGWPLAAEEDITVSSTSNPTAALVMPAVDPAQLNRVKTYLQSQRAIERTVIETLIASGRLYADAHANAVFVLLGKERQIVGAEQRSSRNAWRGMATGSRKNLGYFSISIAESVGEKDRRPIILCESAIDAISCALMHPDYHCISTAGARPNPAWLIPLVDEGRPIYCGYDADDAGDYVAQVMIAKHPTIQRHRPGHHDWNAVLQSRR